jgi:hypothetical protein
LAVLVCPGAALAEESLLHGASGVLTNSTRTDSQVATWLTFRYDAHKEAGVSLPGQKEFNAWLVTGRCRWIQGMNLAAGYQVWSPSPDADKQIRTGRAGISFSSRNKGAELSLERSSYNDPNREPTYGAVAAFQMQF